MVMHTAGDLPRLGISALGWELEGGPGVLAMTGGVLAQQLLPRWGAVSNNSHPRLGLEIDVL